jgi:AcrR family transcriptional regulator
MPRRYDRTRRDEATAATRRRIVDAIVALHAERGASDTTYAMIAERADVAIPTVYKHFPNLAIIFEACVGHVTAKAPAVGPEIFDGLSDVSTRLAALIRALFARHRFMAPWLRWSDQDASVPPELAVHHTRARAAQRQLVEAALAPLDPPPAPLVALIDVLVSFRTWRMLTADHGLTQDQAVDAVTQCARAALTSYATIKGDPP